ncbi:MAG: DUF11 domain-containing protein [Phycisphaeraceae bacterium]|nr:MAG: DUF11 domain-containing protein [Phycisphaeraceae bacterium]
MSLARWLMTGAVVAAGMLGSVAGCESSGQNTAAPPGGPKWDFEPWGGMPYVPKAAPVAEAPKPVTPKPAEQPKPVAAAPKPAPSASSIYYPSCGPNGGILRLDRNAPAEVSASAPFEYTLTATNVSGCDLVDVVVKEGPIQGLTVNNTNPAAVNGPGGEMMFNLGKLAPGESKTVTIRGTPSAAGTIASCASATYVMPLCMNINVVSPKLELAKSGPAESLVCNEWEYTLTVSNPGSGVARNVVIRDQLPSGLTTIDGKTTVEIPVGDLAGGKSETRKIRVKAGRTGRFENTATATADAGLKADSNVVATAVKQPKLQLAKKGPERLYAGRAAAYQITISNTGDATASQTVIEDPVPAGATFVSASDGGVNTNGVVRWNLGDLAPGATKTVTLTVNTPRNIGSIKNVARATATCADPVSAEATTSTFGLPDLATLLTDEDGVVEVGTNHVFIYQVRNQGEVDLTNVRAEVTLPEGMQFVSADTVQPTVAGNKLSFLASPTLKPGEVKNIRITVRATKAGELLATAETRCDQLRQSVRDDEITVFIDKP